MKRKLLFSLAVACAIFAAKGASYLRLDEDFRTGKPTARDKYENRTIAFIGDSYVQNHHRPIQEAWHYSFAKAHHMRYVNLGRNGNRIVYGNSKTGTSICKRFKEIPEEVDYIVVIAGHNETSAIAEADEAKRKQILKDFPGYFRKFLQDVKKTYPKAKLVYVTPWNVDRPYFKEVLETIRKETKAEKVPCYDAAKDSGIDPNDEDFRKKYFQAPNDTAHLNAEGHKLMLQKMEKFFKDLK